MKNSASARPSLDEVRNFERARLNGALRRPGMYGGEPVILLLMEGMAFCDGRHAAWQEQLDELRAAGAFGAAGVQGAFATIFTTYRDEGAAASVYADLAHRNDWLDLDRTLTGDDYRRLLDVICGGEPQDQDLPSVLATFGPPSVWFGGTNFRYPKTLAYVNSGNMVCLHFASTYRGEAPQPQETPPLLVAARRGHNPFRQAFTFTPHGRTHTIDSSL